MTTDRARPPVAATGTRSTLQAVARLAGTSIATVSRVINGRAGVSFDTRDRVEAAVSELGYVSLVVRRSAVEVQGGASIEILVDFEETSHAYLSTFLGGALAAAAELGFGLTLRNLEAITVQQEGAWAVSLARAGRAGVIDVTSTFSPRRETELNRVGLPMVLIDALDVPHSAVCSVGSTNWAGAQAATRHLLDLGHRDVRYVGGPAQARCDTVRARGWAATMADVGVPVDLTTVLHGSYTHQHGMMAATQLLTAKEPLPTAFLTGSDVTAAGIIDAARRIGLRVPQDVSVVGFDDTFFAAAGATPLTTVRQPVAAIAAAAVRMVMDLAGGRSLTTRRVEMDTELVVRSSTGPANLEKES